MARNSSHGRPGSDREPGLRLDAELQLLPRCDDEPRSATASRFAERPHLYNESPSPDSHQRAEMVTDLLSAADKVDVDQAIDIAFNTQVWHAETWQARIRNAWVQSTAADKTGDVATSFRAHPRMGSP